MKKTSYFILTIAIFLSCCGQTKKQDSFEGTLTYKITVATKTDNTNYNDYQKQKYGDKVKIYTVGDFSKEFCGGPHVSNTREIGRFTIIKEEAVSAGVRRIKAVLG